MKFTEHQKIIFNRRLFHNNPVTLVVGIKYNSGKGLIIISDSRIITGTDYSIKQKLFEVINGEVVLGASGYREIQNRLIRETRKKINSSEQKFDLRQLIDLMEDSIKEITDRYKDRFPKEEGLFDGLIGGRIDEGDGKGYLPHLFCLHDNGYADEIEDYDAIGDGERHAINIIKSLYDQKMSKERALQIGIHALIQTAKIDSVVDDFPQIAVIDKEACRILNIGENGEYNETIPQIEEMKKQINGVAKKQSELFDLWLNGSDEIKTRLNEVFEDWKGKKKALV